MFQLRFPSTAPQTLDGPRAMTSSSASTDDSVSESNSADATTSAYFSDLGSQRSWGSRRTGRVQELADLGPEQQLIRKASTSKPHVVFVRAKTPRVRRQQNLCDLLQSLLRIGLGSRSRLR